MKVTIVFGMILFLLGATAGCKEKSEEEEIEELVEKLGDAKTEKEAAEIAKKIEKLQESAKKKSIKEVRVKLGRPFTFWQKDPFGERSTRFSITFEEVSTRKKHPILSTIQRAPAPEGKKYIVITAKLKNLGPREGTPESDMEIKVDKGYLYKISGGLLMSTPHYHTSCVIESLEPGAEGWKLFYPEVPEDDVPVEIIGTLGGWGPITGDTKFRLRLTQLDSSKAVQTKQKEAEQIVQKRTTPRKEISKDSIAGRYIVELVKRDGTTEKLPGITIFKEDGTIVLRDSGSEFVIPDQKWEFKNGAVHFYQRSRSVFEPGWFESGVGKLRGSTIILKIKDGELRYIREDGRPFSLASSAKLRESESTRVAELVDKDEADSSNLFPFEDIIERSRTWNPVFTSWYGKPAPDFSVYDVDGKLYKLSDCRGKNILLIFWATWASLCRAEIPHLIELRNQINDENLVMLAMSNEDMNTLRRFVEKKKLNYSIVSISSSSLPVPFNQINSVPTMFFIDATGKIRLAAAGIVSLNEMKAILTKSRSEPIQEVKSKTFYDVFKQIDTRLKLYSDKSSFPRPPISLTLRMTTPELVEKVESIYFTALDYQFLSLKSLRYAKYFLEKGDIPKANKYIEKADRYYKLATSLQRDSLAVLQSTISAAEWMVVYKASRTALGFTATGLGIEASIIFDIGTLYTDYLLDTSTMSVEEAKKNLIAKAISNVLLRFTGTSEFVGDAVKHGWGSSRDFPVLQKIMGSSEFKDAVLKEFMRLGGDVGDYAARRTIEEALERIVKGAITPSSSKEDSQEPPVQTDKRKKEQTKEIKEQIEEKVEETVESLLDQLFKKKR